MNDTRPVRPCEPRGRIRDDTSDVRSTEQLDWPRLAAYLREHLNLAGGMEVAQFPGGHSNLTYLVRFDDTELVLRRPPFGPLPPRAHDLAREYRWLKAMHPVFGLAPKPYLLCEDASVIGSVFYVMERRRGLVVRRDEPDSLATPDARRRLSETMVDTLATLHAIDVRPQGLADLGKPAGFVERQIRGWTDRWQGSKTSEVPVMDALATWLLEQRPPDPATPSIVHGDFKLDNVMLDAANVTRIVALFDWEMSALGDPLVDVGIFLAYWSPTAPPDQQDALTSVTDRPGWFTREEVIERYALRSGRDVSALRFYEAFAFFKVAVVIQQIYARYVRGQTDDPRFARFDARVAFLARQAAAAAGGA